MPLLRASYFVEKNFFQKGLYKTKIVCYIISNKNHY